jgi:hypothetical protein
MEGNFFQSHAGVSSDVFPILYSVDLWSLSHSVFQPPVKFLPLCVSVGCEVLPSLFQLICEVLSILCCTVLWWSSTLCFSAFWSVFSSLFHWGVKFFSSCVMSCEVLSAAVPVICEVPLFLCSSQLWSFSHSIFQWAVEPGFICQYFNMHGKKQLICLSVCLSVRVVIHCVHWLWWQEKTEWSVTNAVRFCPSICVEGLGKYPTTWTVWYAVWI